MQKLRCFFREFWYFIITIFSVFVIITGLFCIASIEEAISNKFQLDVVNIVGSPLSIQEIWEEDNFSFVVDRVVRLPKEQWIREIPSNRYEMLKDGNLQAFEVQVNFQSNEQNTFSISACGYDLNRDIVYPCPLPTNMLGSMAAKDHRYIVLTTSDVQYIDLVVTVPYEKRKHYEKLYEFKIDDVQ